MGIRLIRSGLGAMVAAAALALSGCGGGGGDGDPPPTTPPVTNPPPVVTPPVEVPTGTSPIVLTSSTPATTFADLDLKVKVGRITIASPPVVHFSITDQDGNAVIGFGSTSQSATATVASYPNLGFSLAKLVPASNGSPSKWVSYIVTTVPSTTAAAAPTRPTTDSTGTLVDNKNGTYSYTFYRDVTTIKQQVADMTVTGAANNKAFLGDLTYEPGLVHRLAIQIAGNAPGTGTNTPNGTQATAGVPLKKPLNVIHDFIPATGQAVPADESGREVAATAKCNECHTKLGGLPGSTSERKGALGAQFHGGARNDVRFCVVCHTEQRKYGRTEATLDTATLTFTSGTNVVDGRAIGNLPNYIHKIHGGAVLAKANYNYAGVAMDSLHYSQDVKNCTKCHDGSATSSAPTAQGDNWKTQPSALACGSCHDGINFATGRGVTMADALAGLKSTSGFAHPAQAQPDDSKCALCHSPASIDVVHMPVTPPDTNSALHVSGGSANTNAAWLAGSNGRLPAGAIKVSYDIKSVSVNADRRPVMVFRLLQNGARKDFNNPASKTEIWDGFMGAPSVYFVFSVPQDGRTVGPDDFNASASSYVRSLWNGTASGNGAGTLTGPDGDGYYTATLTNIAVPTSARLLTGGLGYSYNVSSSLPLTQTNLADYPVANSPINHASGNKIGGLVVVAPNAQKVATGFTGRRAIVDDARCNSCHEELGLFTEKSFHGAQRNDGSSCSWCHNPNRVAGNNYEAPGWSIDSTSFIHAIHGSGKRDKPFTYYKGMFADIGYPGVLQECEACHLPGTYDFRAAGFATADRLHRTVATGTYNDLPLIAPYVTAGINYGTGFSFNAGTGVTNQAASTTLVSSPITTACASCHDTNQAVQHMQGMGGSFYAPRSTALGVAEQCLLCHGPGKIADLKQAHAKR